MRISICKQCGNPTKQGERFCGRVCEIEYYEKIAKQRARAGKKSQNNHLSDEWKAIIKIMRDHDVQYPEAVRIYESEKKK